MVALEKQFEEELIKKCEEAQRECGYKPTRFLETVASFGGVKTAKEMIRKGRVSDGFDKLQQAGLIYLTMEAVVIKPEYEALFTDDEVNSCYELLCDHGYYGV